jgi:hypothetical protein
MGVMNAENIYNHFETNYLNMCTGMVPHYGNRALENTSGLSVLCEIRI